MPDKVRQTVRDWLATVLFVLVAAGIVLAFRGDTFGWKLVGFATTLAGLGGFWLLARGKDAKRDP